MKLLTVWANKKIAAYYEDDQGFGRSREIFADDGSLPSEAAYQFEQLLSVMSSSGILQMHMQEENGERQTYIKKTDTLEVLSGIDEAVFDDFTSWVYDQFEDQYYIKDRQLAEMAK